MTPFSSGLSATIRSYLTLKRALGRQYAAEEWALAHMDRFLAARPVDLIAETFAAWCLTLRAWKPQRVAVFAPPASRWFSRREWFRRFSCELPGGFLDECRCPYRVAPRLLDGHVAVPIASRGALAARGRRRVLLPRFAPSRVTRACLPSAR